MRARKSLGQHFLHDAGLLRRIAEASGATSGDVVLEIGPGPGGLTEALLATRATVVAIERDPRMAGALLRRYADAPFVLIEGDALELDWPALVAPWAAQGSTWRRIAFTIGRGSFRPPPQVDSAVVHLVPRAAPLIAPEDIADFRRLVVSLFSYRRKRIHRALREARDLDADAASALLAEAGIDPDLRPEMLDVAAFVRLLAAARVG